MGKKGNSNQDREAVEGRGWRQGDGHVMNTGSLLNAMVRSLAFYDSSAKPLDSFRGGEGHQSL